MSHEIIKAIKIKDGKCLVTSCSNNVSPRTPHEWECTFISEILQTQGETAAIISILEAYESGNFQTGTPNKYSRAIDRLRYLPEYQNYNWRNKEYGNPNCKIDANRQSEDFKKLLLNSLNLNPPKSKIILTKQAGGETVYLLKVTTRTARWTYKISEAKIFNYEQDTQRVRNMLVGGENFKTITL